MENLGASDDVSETAEPGALVTSEEETGALEEDFPYILQGPSFLFSSCHLLQGFSEIFGNIPISFSGSARMGDLDATSSFHRSFPISCPFLGDIPEADSEAVPMAPLRRRRSCLFDDGPRSEIREGDLANMRRK
ncbi:hypothetical protein F2Q69_00006015 [Brassica cretica]|uniref:Uncharacterized protein n=1 Tax=Brassica cretica TaxID=69181 RepID=A0A8S9NPF8_BRACR|nr:hypothetical protein F2Q69_00006015 [Brassica cretica]